MKNNDTSKILKNINKALGDLKQVTNDEALTELVNKLAKTCKQKLKCLLCEKEDAEYKGLHLSEPDTNGKCKTIIYGVCKQCAILPDLKTRVLEALALRMQNIDDF